MAKLDALKAVAAFARKKLLCIEYIHCAS